jgi:hypothetical protein
MMSGESALHIQLVERLIAMVECRHHTSRGLMVFADHRKFGDNRPPTIGGFHPDVLAQDVPVSFQVIGEAKTRDDLEQERSSRQICAFLDHLALYTNSSFYLGVPWYLKGRANYVLHAIRRPEHQVVNIQVIPFA